MKYIINFFLINKFFLLFIAWGWNSGQSSPTSTKDFKKFVVIRVSGDEKNEAGLSTYIVYCFTVIHLNAVLIFIFYGSGT